MSNKSPWPQWVGAAAVFAVGMAAGGLGEHWRTSSAIDGLRQRVVAAENHLVCDGHVVTVNGAIVCER